jgi:hypothetical protein
MLKKLWVTGLGVFLSLDVYATADSIYDEEFPLIWAPIITLSGGPAWAKPGQNQYLYSNPPPQNDYYHYNSKTGILATSEIFFGLQRFVYPCLIGQLGLGVAGASDAKASGEVDVDGIPAVNAYDYKVNHARIELKGKLIATYYKLVQPYVSGSFGGGFNNTHAYVPTTIDPVLYPPFWFAAKTTRAFSYTLGAGLQTNLDRHWQVGAGYEFADWGKSYLAPDPLRPLYPIVTNGPGLTHLYTHELLFSLSYLF